MVKILFADKNTSEMENISSEIFTIEEKSNYFDIKYFEDEDKIKYQYWNYNPDVFILDGSLNYISILKYLSLSKVTDMNNVILMLPNILNKQLCNVEIVNSIFYKPLNLIELKNCINKISNQKRSLCLTSNEVDLLFSKLGISSLAAGYSEIRDEILYLYDYSSSKKITLDKLFNQIAVRNNVPPSIVKNNSYNFLYSNIKNLKTIDNDIVKDLFYSLYRIDDSSFSLQDFLIDIDCYLKNKKLSNLDGMEIYK